MQAFTCANNSIVKLRTTTDIVFRASKGGTLSGGFQGRFDRLHWVYKDTEPTDVGFLMHLSNGFLLSDYVIPVLGKYSRLRCCLVPLHKTMDKQHLG